MTHVYDHAADPEHVMRAYRAAILGFKRRNGGQGFRRGARSQVHYRDWLSTYLAAKAIVIRRRRAACEYCASGLPLIRLEPGTPAVWHDAGGGTLQSCAKQRGAVAA